MKLSSSSLFLCLTMKKPRQNQSFSTHNPVFLALAIITALSLTQTALSTDFVFNGFNSTDPILLVGNATVESADKTLTLTNHSHFSIGRAFYNTKIPARRSNISLPFSTSFIFAMAPRRGALPGHGLVFLFAPAVGFTGTPSAQNLGFINRTDNGRAENHIFGVEFDVFKNQEFDDIDANHVGIDVNSLNSAVAHEAGVWEEESKFRRLKLNNGENYQVWIDYNNSVVTVAMAVAGERKPRFPLLSYDRDLSDIFIDDMFVGFTSSTGQLIQSHKILAWSFSNDNFSLSESLITVNLPSFVLPRESIFKNTAFVAVFAVSVAVIVVLAGLLAMCLTKRHRRIARERAEMEEWELEYWPHRMTHREVEEATQGFSEKNVIGSGGNGKVYRGVLKGGAEVAVKRMPRGSDGTREFLAEVSSLGRLRHRSLVGLRGWCKRDKGVFMLVYDYMENGSLDKRVYHDSDDSQKLGFDDRMRILNDMARGVLYLHEGWESQVLHRDIKASNVLLDKDMNGRLGDFGLARVHSHAHVIATTRVVGTVGYLAPEVVRNGRVSAQSDVFAFGALVLEVVCGRRPIEEGKPPLVEWVWEAMSRGTLLEVVDSGLRAKGEFDNKTAERVLQLGLLCAYPDPASRPSMRQVVKILEGSEAVGDLESEEDMGAYLLEKVKNGDLWTSFSRIVGYGSHPTFEDIRESVSSSMSVSWSNTIVDQDIIGPRHCGKKDVIIGRGLVSCVNVAKFFSSSSSCLGPGLHRNGERRIQGQFATI